MSSNDGGFQELLSQLSKAHLLEVDQVRKECDLRISSFSQEVQALRTQLREAGIPPPTDHGRGQREEHCSAQKLTAGHTEVGGCQHLVLGGGDQEKAAGAEDGTTSPASSASSADNAFEIKSVWETLMESATWGSSLDSFLVRCGNSGDRETTVSGPGSEKEAQRNKYVILPNSVFRMNWDFMGLVLICYDLITIPFNHAFQPQSHWFTTTMDWFILLFWTGDMIQGFFLGYFEKGQFITSHQLILRRYLSTWFVIDMVVVGPEWIMMILSPDDDSGAVGASKILKAARAVRVLRLLRLAKIQRMLNLVYDLIESEYTFIVVNLAKLLVSVLALNHVVACLWYVAGKWASDRHELNWIEASGTLGESTPYVYCTSLHWSLTQFTPASMDVSAKNLVERIFSIIILFFAMVVFSSIVGSISGSMTTLRSMKSDQMKQFWLLRRYLRQRDVSKDLSSRIYKYLEHQSLKQNNIVQASQLKILDGLSESLQNELTHQMHSPHLLEHQFFKTLNEEMEVVMHKLCRLALKQQSYAEREYVFGAGDEAKKTFFVKSGTLDYTAMDGKMLRPPPQPKECISEALLWTAWRHQGDLVALIESELISVDPTHFVEVMSLHPRPWFYAKHYAERYVKFLNQLGRRGVTDILREREFHQEVVLDTESGLGQLEVTSAPRRPPQCSPEGAYEQSPPPDDADTNHWYDPGGVYQQSQGIQDGVRLSRHSNREPRLPIKVPWSRAFGFCPCPRSFSSVLPGA